MEARRGMLPPMDYRRPMEGPGPLQRPSMAPPGHHGRSGPPPSMALPGHGRPPAAAPSSAPSSAPPPRAIPPSSVPSLSSGQGFYTVESLQHATVVPPAQLLPPPRLLPPAEHFPVPERPLDRFDNPPRSRPHFPDDRAFASPPIPRPSRLDRGRPPLGRDMPPHRDLPPRVLGPLARGGPRMRQPPPPFLMDPRVAGFHPGRDSRGRGWGPSRDIGLGRRFDRGRPFPSLGARKQLQKSRSIPKAKSALPSATADKKSPVENQEQVEGGPGWCSVCQINCFRAETLEKHLAGKRHKRQLEKLEGEPDEAKKEGEEIHDEPEELTEVDGEDQVMKEEEDASVVEEVAKTVVNVESIEAPNEVKEIEQAEAAVAVKAATPGAGKKRVVRDKDVGAATKKRQKAAMTSDVQENVTVPAAGEDEEKVESSKNVEKAADIVEVCQLCNVTCSSKSIMENHLKGKKHAARLKKSAGISDSKGAVDEGAGVTAAGDLANGSAGQSV